MRALSITTSITRRDEKSLDKYLSEISKHEVLSPQEELKLFKEYKSGDEAAFSKILHHNLRFVVSVAKQYQDIGLKLGDLINEGNIGLIKAAQRFDETKGFKFISYAVWWIRQSILQAINEKGRSIRLPLNLNSISTKVKSKRDEILQRKEREPSINELAEATELPRKTVAKCLQTINKCRSLDAPIKEDSDQSLVNMMVDSSIPDPDFKLAIRESQHTEVQELLKLLPPRQARIISLYYGIGLRNALTLSDISEIFGLSRERVRQIRDRGLLKLRMRARKFAPTLSAN